MQPLRIPKDPRRVRLNGSEYEFKLAGLIASRLRAENRRHPGLQIRFVLTTNMEGANPFDDLILRLQWTEDSCKHKVNYFMQLKHAERSDKFVNESDLAAKYISKRKKDFNLRKYFQFYKHLQNLKNIPEKNDVQILLSEMVKEECRFIIFTTRDILPGNASLNRKSLLRFPFDGIFDTGQGNTLSYWEDTSEVWNMFEEPECSIFRFEFLPRLMFYGGQAHACQLDSLIQESLLDFLGGTIPRLEHLLSQYITFLRQWWDREDSECITEYSQEIQNILKDLINSNGDLFPLEFEISHYSDLQKHMKECKVSYIIVHEMSFHLRCSKVRPVLDQISPGRFLILTDSSFRDFPEHILESVCKTVCEELVLNLDHFNNQQKRFLNRILSAETCNVRVVQSSLDEDLLQLISSMTNSCVTFLDKYWILGHLSRNEQERLVVKCIYFQGYKTTLAALEERWPSLRLGVGGATLDALVCGDIVELGTPLPPEGQVYISRTLTHTAALDDKIFEIKAPDHHFLLQGFPKTELEKLRCPTSPWDECDLQGIAEEDSSTDKLDGKKACDMKEDHSKWSIWNNSSRPKLESLGRKKNVHWLIYEADEIIWCESHGESDILHEFVKNYGSTCQRNSVCYHNDTKDFVDWKGRFVLTCDPGMGKSTFITRLAHEIKKNDPTEWVVLMRLNEGKLLEGRNRFRPENVVDLMMKSLNIRNPAALKETKNYLRDCLLESGHISVLVDGVEDVCPTYKESFFKFLQVLTYRLKPMRVWICGRVLLEDELTRAVGCPSFTLLPFTLADQQIYLLSHWSQGDSEEAEELKSTVELLVEDVREATIHNGRSLCDVPLYANMLAVAYKDELAKWDFSSDDWKTHRTKAISLITLIQKFVEETRKVYWEKAGVPLATIKNHRWASKLDAEFRQEHHKCAVFLSLHDRNLLGDLLDTIERDVQELARDLEREKTGLITNFVDGKPQFIHDVFAEYFSAQWLKENYSRLQPGALEALFSESFDEVRFFFDALLSEGLPLHEAVLSGSADAMHATLERLKVRFAHSGGSVSRGRRLFFLGRQVEGLNPAHGMEVCSCNM